MHSWEEKKSYQKIADHIFKIPQLENISKYAFEMFTKQM